MNMNISTAVQLRGKTIEFAELIKDKHIVHMVGAAMVRYNSARDEGNATRKANVTQETQVTLPQILRRGKLEKRSREVANNSFGSL